LLSRIARPSDVRAFNDDELGRLVDEVRQTIIHTAAANGGHLAPHLGVVELAIALHHVFDTERDELIWDVGHQCYAHKLLTGRAGRIATIRKKGGLSGYPKRCESPFDAFGVGHSSTSISAGLGMAIARDLQGDDRRVVAVIGDGAMTAGMAFEALAHAGHVGTDLLVILNDNKMSISPNVGALSAYLSRLITGGLYNRAREDINALMRNILGQQVAKAAQRVEHSVKGLLTPGTIFEELGFKYVGPVDGHDLPTLIDCFKNLKHIRGPVFFHCVTKKGKGYGYAEDDPVTYHGVKEFDVATGQFKAVSAPAPTFTDVFADTLIEAAREDERIVGITAAMPGGTGLARFEKAFPNRFFDVGICEQHAVTLGAGMAADGLKPVCAIYSTFLQRAYDQYLHDVCLQNLPVVFAIDRAGAVGEDSPTQQGAFDLSFLRVVPNVSVLAPRDAEDLRAMLRWALKQDGPVAVRYARCRANPIGPEGERDIARGEVLREGTDATILGLGPCLAQALEAAETLQAEGLSVGVCDARWVKPLDEALVLGLAGRPILTLEENTVVGGFGSAVLELLNAHGRLADTPVAMAGFPDAFIDHGTRSEQLEDIGVDAVSLVNKVRALAEQGSSQPANTP
jgi:1-deoxy-D-xylulose-5-phosphate synthase